MFLSLNSSHYLLPSRRRFGIIHNNLIFWRNVWNLKVKQLFTEEWWFGLKVCFWLCNVNKNKSEKILFGNLSVFFVLWVLKKINLCLFKVHNYQLYITCKTSCHMEVCLSCHSVLYLSYVSCYLLWLICVLFLINISTS